MIYSKKLNIVIVNYCLFENRWFKYVAHLSPGFTGVRLPLLRAAGAEEQQNVRGGTVRGVLILTSILLLYW